MMAVEEEWGKTSRSKHPIIQLISDFIQEEEEEEEEEEDSLLWRHLPSKKSNVGRPPPPPQRGGGGGGVFQAKREEKGNPSLPHTYRSGVAKNKGVMSLFKSSRRLLLS